MQVLSVDRDRKRIGLSIKRLEPEPWETVGDRYTVGQLVEGTVTKITDFGAFAQLEDGIEGLIHVSELSDRRVRHPNEVVKEGDKVTLRVIRVEPEKTAHRPQPEAGDRSGLRRHGLAVRRGIGRLGRLIWTRSRASPAGLTGSERERLLRRDVMQLARENERRSGAGPAPAQQYAWIAGPEACMPSGPALSSAAVSDRSVRGRSRPHLGKDSHMADNLERYFTRLARRVLILAQEEAERLNHSYIGTEHLLVGLTREKEGVAHVSARRVGGAARASRARPWSASSGVARVVRRCE